MKFARVISVISAVMICISAAGCHEEEKAKMQEDAYQFCQSFKDMDFEAMYALTHDKNRYFNDIYVEGAEGSEVIFKSMADNLEFEIGECTIDGENASVSAKISNVDMNIAMGSVLNQYFALCEENPDNIDNIKLDEIITETVNDPAAQRREANTSFDFIKRDGEWVLESNVMIYDDVTGGYMTYYFQANMAVNSEFEGTEETTK